MSRGLTSTAVMARRVEPPDSWIISPTPPWATRALCELLGGRVVLSGLVASDPACGELYMAKPLAEYFRAVIASDVHDYGAGQDLVEDFLFPGSEWLADWIITNPPFRLGLEFALAALARAVNGVALFIRLQWLESEGRYSELFSRFPPSLIAQFVERVPLVKGRVDPEASVATAYVWVVWDKAYQGPTRFEWIAPCRKKLERADDYPPRADAAPAALPLFGGAA
ncbi:SAM-dependent DNA methyltransferase [Elstera litoralis]|nr:SAM-dependent DNA methyltransferase [Elstera litoralis]